MTTPGYRVTDFGERHTHADDAAPDGKMRNGGCGQVVVGGNVPSGRHMKTLALVAVTGVCLAAAGAGGYHATSTCIIGVRGTRATVTVEGLGATFRCKDFIPKSGGSDYYIKTERATEPVLCEGDRSGLHYTVRDDGMLVIVGRLLCGDLNRPNP